MDIEENFNRIYSDIAKIIEDVGKHNDMVFKNFEETGASGDIRSDLEELVAYNKKLTDPNDKELFKAITSAFRNQDVGYMKKPDFNDIKAEVVESLKSQESNSRRHRP